MPSPTPPVVALSGVQGAGKRTQARRLARAMRWEYLSVPSLLRSASSCGTGSGREIGDAIRNGERIRPDLVSAVVVDAVRQCEEGAVLDGFPRSLPEVELARESGLQIDLVVQFVVSVKEAMTRLTARRQCLSCGQATADRFLPTCVCGGELLRRRDDRPEAILKRLALFDEETQPALNWLDTGGLLVRISGRGEPDAVTERMILALGAHPHTATRIRSAARQQVPALAC